MPEELHWFMVVNGYTYGVRASYGTLFARQDGAKGWRIQVAQYGVNNAISIGGLDVVYEPDTDNEYHSLAEAAGAAMMTILYHQLKEDARAKADRTTDPLVRDSILL